MCLVYSGHTPLTLPKKESMSVKNYPKVRRIYLDLDGPAANFDKKFKELNIDPKIMKVMPGIYRLLEIVPGAIEGVRLLSRLGMQVWFLTKVPDENALAATEKLQWVAEHFPAIAERIIITPDKAVCGTVEDFLIDDHPQWANAHNFRGTLITFNRGDRSDEALAAEWQRVVLLFFNNNPSPYKGYFQNCVVNGVGAGEKVSPNSYTKAIEFGMNDVEYNYFSHTGLHSPSFLADVTRVHDMWVQQSQEQR